MIEVRVACLFLEFPGIGIFVVGINHSVLVGGVKGFDHDMIEPGQAWELDFQSPQAVFAAFEQTAFHIVGIVLLVKPQFPVLEVEIASEVV